MKDGKIPEPGILVPERRILVIDQTIREGMQHRGIVFSQKERAAILEFQAELGVDICQAGYASAHITEQENIAALNTMVRNRGWPIRIAGMGRAHIQDVIALVNTGISDFHLHARIPRIAEGGEPERSLEKIVEAVKEIRNRVTEARISVATLDIGASSSDLLEKVAGFLIKDLKIDLLSLPDTSGIMAPDDFFDTINRIAQSTCFHQNQNAGHGHGVDGYGVDEHGIDKKVFDEKGFAEADQECTDIGGRGTVISVHCHNDLGMASANTLMGVKAGAGAVELSALGIGERNGIGDLFTVSSFLRRKGYHINVDTDNTALFRKYYDFVSDICREQTGDALLSYNTPFFGKASITHVAGTHSAGDFGIFGKGRDRFEGSFSGIEEEFYLNVLCGKALVKRYLDSNMIQYDPDKVGIITGRIKALSASLGRSLQKDEIRAISLER